MTLFGMRQMRPSRRPAAMAHGLIEYRKMGILR